MVHLRARELFTKGTFDVAVSLPLLAEISEVLRRRRIRDRYGLEEREIVEFVRLLASRGTRVALKGNLRVCRDPDDDAVLETAVLSGTECVVTRDDDLKGEESLTLELERRGVEILTLQRFLDRLETTDS